MFYYDKRVRYSVNPLIAAIDRACRDVNIDLASSLKDVYMKARDIRSRGDTCVVAFSLLTTMLTNEAFFSDLVKLVKDLKNRGCIIIAGGPHATGDPLGSLKSLGFNYVFIGEGESSLTEFILELQNGGDVKRVKGLTYIEDDKLIFTGRRVRVDLNEYDPFPYWRGIFQPIEITRGCPYGCFYCQVSYMHGFEYRHRNVEKIAYYVEIFLKRHGKDVRFITPNGMSYGLKTSSQIPRADLLEYFLSSIKAICDKYNGRLFYGTFPSEVRPEYVTDETMRVLSKYVANKRIIIGAQSGSERLLRFLRRRHSVEDVKNAVEVALKYNFIPDIDLILGLPGEEKEDMFDTLKLAKWVVDKGGRIHVHYFMPLPGTPLSNTTPTPIPVEVKKHIARIIGSHRGYGEWLHQEEIAWKIVKLREAGIIRPKYGGLSFYSI